MVRLAVRFGWLLAAEQPPTCLLRIELEKAVSVVLYFRSGFRIG